jgi:hypothetical protein
MGRIATSTGARSYADRRCSHWLLLGALGLHLAASTSHGLTHGLVPVDLAPWQNAVVLATTFVGPVIGAALWLRGDGDASFAPRLGLVVFTGSLALAFAFGVYFHFVVWNPDHVHAVPADPWRLPFQTSAVGVAAANALATAVGVSCLARSR